MKPWPTEECRWLKLKGTETPWMAIFFDCADSFDPIKKSPTL
jgi:hypothetical protein